MFGRRAVALPEPAIEREEVVAIMDALMEIRGLARRIVAILEEDDEEEESGPDF